MRVAVTGGSGQFGTIMLRRLLDAPEVERVRSLDLRPPLVVGDKLDWEIADVRDQGFEKHLEEADVLIHLAFIVTSAVPRDVFDGVNIEGSKNVFNSALAAGVSQIIYASSMAQYGVTSGHPNPIVETTPRVYVPTFPYSAAKHDVEVFLDALEEAHPKLIVTRLRPAVLVGTHFQNPLAKLLGRALDRGIMPVTNGASFPLVWDEDVVEAALLAMTKKAHGAFNLQAAEPLEGRTLARRAGLRPLAPPKFLLSGLAIVAGGLAKLGIGEPVERSWQDHSEVDMVLSAEKARSELGWTPSCDTSVDVLKRYLVEAPGKMNRDVAAFLRKKRHATIDGTTSIHLRLTGRGGGDITIETGEGRTQVELGIPQPPTSSVDMPVALFADLSAGRASWDRAKTRPEVRFRGDDAAVRFLAASFG